MSVLTLPEPKGWRDGRRTVRWVLLGWFVFNAPMVCWGVAATIRGHYLTTAFTIGWAVLIVATGAALMLALFGKTSLRAAYDSTGTTVRPDRWFSVLCFAGFAVFVPSGVLFVIFAPRGDIDIPMSRGMQIFSPALMGSAVVVAVVTLITAWRRGGMGYLKLTPVGIDNANVAFTNSVDWDDVFNVTDKAETKRNRKAIVLLLQDGSEEIIGGADIYVPRGAALYWMVRHYWHNPQDRPELTDARALDRLREGRFQLG